MFVFCGTIMAVQVDRQSWPFSHRGFLDLKKRTRRSAGTDLVDNSSKIHFEYLRKHEECLIYVANMSVFWGCFNVWYELSAPHIAEIFNAIFSNLARSVLVVREIKGCCFTACFYLMDQSGDKDTYNSINGVWSLMTHFSLKACCVISQKMISSL